MQKYDRLIPLSREVFMIHQKDASPPAFWRGGQVGQTIAHYKILEKLGEGGLVRRNLIEGVDS